MRLDSPIRTWLCPSNLFNAHDLMRSAPRSAIRIRICDHNGILADCHINRIGDFVSIAIRQPNFERHKWILKQHMSDGIEIHFIHTEIF